MDEERQKPKDRLVPGGGVSPTERIADLYAPGPGGGAPGEGEGLSEGGRSLKGRPPWERGSLDPAFRREVIIVTTLFIVLVLGLVGGHVFFTTDWFAGWGSGKQGASLQKEATVSGADLTSIKIYYPFEEGLRVEERRVLYSDSKVKMTRAALTEFLKGAARTESYVPEGAEVRGIYSGKDGILYIDLSHEFRSNFQGDALAEFLLLRGLYESIARNVSEIRGIKVLIDGKEVETIGGHISMPGTLGAVVSQIMLERDGGRR